MNLAQRYRARQDGVSVRAGAVRELPNGEIAISPTQRNIHVFFEGVAVFVAAPICIGIAYTNKDLPPWQRTFLYAMAGVTLAVDGGLLWSYANKRKAGQ